MKQCPEEIVLRLHEPTRVLTEVFGVSFYAIQQWRREHGILIRRGAPSGPKNHNVTQRIEQKHPGLPVALVTLRDIECARRFGLSRERIRQIRKLLGVQKHYRGVINTVFRDTLERYTQEHAAEVLGLHITTVKRRAKALGILSEPHTRQWFQRSFRSRTIYNVLAAAPNGAQTSVIVARCAEAGVTTLVCAYLTKWYKRGYIERWGERGGGRGAKDHGYTYCLSSRDRMMSNVSGQNTTSMEQ